MFDLIWRGILIGIGATVVMDIWAVVFSFFLGQERPNWGLIGRWVWHLQNGQIFHDDIEQSLPYQREIMLGWAFHYVIGIIYGVLFAFCVGVFWFISPTFLPAWIFGMVTILAGWLILQPGIGIGLAASNLSNANTVRISNIIAHTFFAVGMYGTAFLYKIVIG